MRALQSLDSDLTTRQENIDSSFNAQKAIKHVTASDIMMYIEDLMLSTYVFFLIVYSLSSFYFCFVQHYSSKVWGQKD